LPADLSLERRVGAAAAQRRGRVQPARRQNQRALQLSGTGGSEDEIKHSLAGQGSIAISDGSIEGINLTELIQGVGAGQMPNLEQGPGAKTTFSSFGVSFNIASGVAETHDLEMTSSLLKVTGRGTVDVVTSSLDFSPSRRSSPA
jgi:AsmA protein